MKGMLPWGSTRPVIPRRVIQMIWGEFPPQFLFFNASEDVSSITMVLILIAWMIDNRLASLISIYPTFIFSNGRIPEVI